jgi:hypothetical protein
VTTITGRAEEASTASTVRRIIGAPSTAASSLLSAPQRRDRPAARIAAATLGL